MLGLALKQANKQTNEKVPLSAVLSSMERQNVWHFPISRSCSP